MNPHVNLLIGINGSGKSNFLKVIQFLKEGIAGIGLKKYVLDHLGGIDNILFKGNEHVSTSVEIEYILDGKAITNGNYGFRFTDDIVYKITLTKAPSSLNYYVSERIETVKGYLYLDVNNGAGHLNEKSETTDNKNKLIRYADFDPQELALKEVSDTDRYYALTTIKKAIRDIFVYNYFDTTPRSPIRKPMLPTSEKRLLPDGANLPQILNTIKINHKQSYNKIMSMLKEVNPNFEEFDFNMIGGNIELLLGEKHLNSSIHVSSISDGTLRYLCLLAILFNPDRGRFICIDEPEVGLHPDMIINVADAIKAASELSTLIISTHSDNLLNYFDIDQIRVFEKNEQNATEVMLYSEDQFIGWYETFSPGLMWKQGDLGGVRYGS